MLDVRPGDLALLDGAFGTDIQVVTVTWVLDNASDGIPLTKCIGHHGQLASCTHRVRSSGTRLLRGERR
jgi:hypothetical protein